ncbi:MAG: hypothetical protein ACOYOV_02395 [Bacteroidales bacterium]
MKKLKKIAVIVLIFLTGTFSGVSQTQTPEIAFLGKIQFKPGVNEYYKNVNKAEWQIVKGNYSKASGYYSKAFKYKEPFSIDLRRAIIAEYLSDRDSATIVNYFILKIKIRYTPTDITEKLEEYGNYYPELIKMKYWKSLPRILETVKIQFLREDALSDALDSLSEADQRIRMEGIAKYTQPKLYKAPYADTIRTVDSINITKLIALWEKYGEISERKAPSAESNLEVLIMHATKWHDTRWLKYLKIQLGNGTLDNKVYSRLIDRCILNEYSQLINTDKSDFFGTSMGFTLYNKYLAYRISNEKEKEINNRRKQVCLSSFQKEQEKSRWQFRQNIANFNLNFLFYTNSFMDFEENATEEMIKQYNAEQNKIIKRYNEKDIKLYNR